MRSEHKRGRPKQPPQDARSNRIVTFVTLACEQDWQNRTGWPDLGKVVLQVNDNPFDAYR